MLYVHDQVLRLCPTSYSPMHELRIFMHSVLSNRANFAKWTSPLPFLTISDTKFVGQSVTPPPTPTHTHTQNKQAINTCGYFRDYSQVSWPMTFYKELPWTTGWIKSSSFTSDTSRKCETTQWNTAKLHQPTPNSPVPLHWYRACEKFVNKIICSLNEIAPQ